MEKKNQEVVTTAGIIKIFVDDDPFQPGVAVMFNPSGTDELIDLSYVYVCQDSALSRDGERYVDVVIQTYANVFTEDYTSKDIIKREDVVDALNICNGIEVENVFLSKEV